jgi:hypothetical protein
VDDEERRRRIVANWLAEKQRTGLRKSSGPACGEAADRLAEKQRTGLRKSSGLACGEAADWLAEKQRTGADPCNALSLCGAPHEELRIPRMRARISREAVRALAQDCRD